MAIGALAALVAGGAGPARTLRVTPSVRPPPRAASARASPAQPSALPPAVASFLAEGFGRVAPEAPIENRFFAQLVGVWKCALKFRDGTSAYPSTWAFKHSLGGFAVDHLYFQAKEDLVPPLRALGRDLQSKAMTLYDPAIGVWRFVGASNIAGSGLGEATQTMSGALRHGTLVFQRDALNREIFANASHQSFVWRKERSPDGGASWELTALIECRKNWTH